MAAIFQTIFFKYIFDWKCRNFTEVCFQDPINNISTIGSNNGLVQGRRQAIIWTNDG